MGWITDEIVPSSPIAIRYAGSSFATISPEIHWQTTVVSIFKDHAVVSIPVSDTSVGIVIIFIPRNNGDNIELSTLVVSSSHKPRKAEFFEHNWFVFVE